MSKLIVYSPVVGGFLREDAQTKAVLAQAKQDAGETIWKRSYSGELVGGATQIAKTLLKAAGISLVEISGAICKIAYRENIDASKNVHAKVHVGIDGAEKLLLSIDLGTDVGMRLVQKLANCTPGQVVKITAWPSPVDRGGRQFVNHAVSVKDESGTEVPALEGFFAKIAQETEAAAEQMKGMGLDSKIIDQAKVTKRVQVHKELLQKISEQFEVPLAA